MFRRESEKSAVCFIDVRANSFFRLRAGVDVEDERDGPLDVVVAPDLPVRRFARPSKRPLPSVATVIGFDITESSKRTTAPPARAVNPLAIAQ